jgi:hypothetical protein
MEREKQKKIKTVFCFFYLRLRFEISPSSFSTAEKSDFTIKINKNSRVATWQIISLDFI